jgi:amidohydrolase
MDDLTQRLVSWRRHLHAHPELSLQEKGTAAFVAARLGELGIPVAEGVGGYGVVGTLHREGSLRAVGLRADMDALPILEQTGLPYASTHPGVMHACGHDGHTTALLGAAAILAGDESWRGTIHLVFQPAEEGNGGARAMMADGLFRRFPMERIFAFHNWPGLALGEATVHEGPVMAGGARVSIEVLGHAGHAAQPHLTRDPMLAAAHLLVALQSVVSRTVDPLESAVVSICTIDGGVAPNQIPDRAEMRGTIRAFRPEVREAMENTIRRVTQGIAQAFGLDINVAFSRVIPTVVNLSPEAVLAARAAAKAGLLVRRDLAPAMTSEDFGWLQQETPGAFVWIGNGEATPRNALHNPAYDFNDAILPSASLCMARMATEALAL